MLIKIKFNQNLTLNRQSASQCLEKQHKIEQTASNSNKNKLKHVAFEFITDCIRSVHSINPRTKKEKHNNKDILSNCIQESSSWLTVSKRSMTSKKLPLH